MRNKILITSAVVSNVYFLGPMGDPNPFDFIHQETNQIPFKQFVVDLSSWTIKTPFRNWPKMPRGGEIGFTGYPRKRVEIGRCMI